MAWKYKYTRAYLEFALKGFELTKQGYKVKISWNGDALDLQGFRKEFLKALHNRIALKAEQYDIGRKHEPLYQLGLIRDQRRLEDIARRVRVYQFETPEIKRRFGHLLSDRNE